MGMPSCVLGIAMFVCSASGVLDGPLGHTLFHACGSALYVFGCVIVVECWYVALPCNYSFGMYENIVLCDLRVDTIVFVLISGCLYTSVPRQEKIRS